MANERELDLELDERRPVVDLRLGWPPASCMNGECSNRPTVGYGPRPAVDFAGGRLPERVSTLWLCDACNRPEVLLALATLPPRS